MSAPPPLDLFPKPGASSCHTHSYPAGASNDQRRVSDQHSPLACTRGESDSCPGFVARKRYRLRRNVAASAPVGLAVAIYQFGFIIWKTGRSRNRFVQLRKEGFDRSSPRKARHAVMPRLAIFESIGCSTHRSVPGNGDIDGSTFLHVWPDKHD